MEAIGKDAKILEDMGTYGKMSETLRSDYDRVEVSHAFRCGETWGRACWELMRWISFDG